MKNLHFIFCILYFVNLRLTTPAYRTGRPACRQVWLWVAFCIFLFPPFGGIKGGLAQQIPLYSQYLFNPSVYNPSYAGNRKWASFDMLYRTQWKLVPGSPATTVLSADAPLKEKKTGVGISLFTDKIGYISQFGIYGSYAYRANFSEDVYLLMGVKLGVLDQKIDLSSMSGSAVNDPAVLQSSEREISPDANAGFAFYAKGIDFGVAFPQLIANKLTYEDGANDMFFKLSRHYVGSLKYTWLFGKEKQMSLSPSVLTRWTPNTPFQYDGGITFNYKDAYWLGIMYKSGYAIGINARVLFANRFNLGYGYEYIINDLAGYVGLSHEITLGFLFSPKGGGQDERLDTLLQQLFGEGNLQYNYALQRADSLFRIGEFQEALANYQAALSYKPNSPYAQQQVMKLNNMLDSLYRSSVAEGDSLIKKGKYLQARDKYLQALKYRPNSPYAREKVEMIDSKYTTAYRTAIATGDMLLEDRKYAQAKKMYEKALQLNPDDEYAKEQLKKLERLIKEGVHYDRHIQSADSLYMSGHYDAALNEYKKALEYYPGDAYSQDMISQIERKKEGGSESVRLYATDEFVDMNGQPVEKGYYVVIASFKNIENAKRAINKKGVGVVYSKKTNYYYCYTKRHETYKEAKTDKSKSKEEVPDIWTFILK